MFGISFTELMLVSLVALLVVGPAKLPKMLGTLGVWVGKARRMTTDMRRQSGIDDVLKAEGLTGGLTELRGLVRGDMSALSRVAGAATAPRAGGPSTAGAPVASSNSSPVTDPYEGIALDLSREYPEEGCDAAGALPDDLWSDPELDDDAEDDPGESSEDAPEMAEANSAPEAAADSDGDSDVAAANSASETGKNHGASESAAVSSSAPESAAAAATNSDGRAVSNASTPAVSTARSSASAGSKSQTSKSLRASAPPKPAAKAPAPESRDSAPPKPEPETEAPEPESRDTAPPKPVAEESASSIAPAEPHRDEAALPDVAVAVAATEASAK